MEHPDITAWLDGLEERRNLEKLEVKAALAWYEGLSLVQRHVFDKLVDNHHGLRFQQRIRYRVEVGVGGLTVLMPCSSRAGHEGAGRA